MTKHLVGCASCKPGGCSAIGCEGGHYCFDEAGSPRPAWDPREVVRAIFPNLPEYHWEPK